MLGGVGSPGLYNSIGLTIEFQTPTARTVTEILWCGQEEVGTPTRGPAAGWR